MAPRRARSRSARRARETAPHLAGFVLIAVSLAGLLALLWADRVIAAPIARFFNGLFGWLAGLGLAWIGIAGLLLAARGVRVHRGTWWRLLAAGGAILGLLTLDGLEPSRPDGLLGRAAAQALRSNLGLLPTAALAGALLLAGATAAAGIRASQLARATRPIGYGALWGASAALWGARALVDELPRWARALRRLAASVPLDRFGWPRLGGILHLGAPGSGERLAGSELGVQSSEPGGGDSALSTEPSELETPWRPPPVGIFSPHKGPAPAEAHQQEQARIIEETLASFGIEARVVDINRGPAVTQFGVEPAVGVAVNRIMARRDDLALRLAATPLRLEAPVPGRRIVGVEVPNDQRSVVGLRDILESDAFFRGKAQIPLALGRDIGGKPIIADLARMPHLLIAGATGSGKSVCLNAMVACLLSQFTPDQLQFIMIDPKMVELTNYNGVPHLRMPVVTELDRTVGTLKWATQEMERRYKLFATHTVRNIDGFNQMARSRGGERPLPYLVVIIDELADLMMTAPDEAERTICRLAQLARATGIHLVVATQRPSVDVVTGLIKANFPSRISFAVTSQIDSRVILDTVGAERLLGRGDMLFLPPDASKPVRIQGTYVSEEEIEELVKYWTGLGAPQYDSRDLEDVESLTKAQDPSGEDLYERAVQLARQTGRISVSFLQRRLGIGYPRAARLVDLLEERGIISSAEDGRSREVLVQGELPPPE